MCVCLGMIYAGVASVCLSGYDLGGSGECVCLGMI